VRGARSRPRVSWAVPAPRRGRVGAVACRAVARRPGLRRGGPHGPSGCAPGLRNTNAARASLVVRARCRWTAERLPKPGVDEVPRPIAANDQLQPAQRRRSRSIRLVMGAGVAAARQGSDGLPVTAAATAIDTLPSVGAMEAT